VEAGVNGLHVDVDQPAEMAAAVRQLLAEPKLAGRLVEEGRRAVADRYSWEAAKREWVGLYSSLHRARNTRLGRAGGA
jgi:glycosyltransferase involved in cell wall biosynthesis